MHWFRAKSRMKDSDSELPSRSPGEKFRIRTISAPVCSPLSSFALLPSVDKDSFSADFSSVCFYFLCWNRKEPCYSSDVLWTCVQTTPWFWPSLWTLGSSLITYRNWASCASPLDTSVWGDNYSLIFLGFIGFLENCLPHDSVSDLVATGGCTEKVSNWPASCECVFSTLTLKIKKLLNCQNRLILDCQWGCLILK